MLLGDGSYPIGIRTAAIEVHQEDGSGAGGDGGLDQGIIDLQGIQTGLDKDGNEAILSDGEDGGNVGIGRDNDFIARLQTAKLHAGTEHEDQSIEATGAADTKAGANILRISGLEIMTFLAQQIPAALNNPGGGLLDLFGITGIDSLKVEELNHVDEELRLLLIGLLFALLIIVVRIIAV